MKIEPGSFGRAENALTSEPSHQPQKYIILKMVCLYCSNCTSFSWYHDAMIKGTIKNYGFSIANYHVQQFHF